MLLENALSRPVLNSRRLMSLTMASDFGSRNVPSIAAAKPPQFQNAWWGAMEDTWRIRPRSGGELATMPTEHRASESANRGWNPMVVKKNHFKPFLPPQVARTKKTYDLPYMFIWHSFSRGILKCPRKLTQAWSWGWKMPLRELRAYMLAVGEPRAYMLAEADWR